MLAMRLETLDPRDYSRLASRQNRHQILTPRLSINAAGCKDTDDRHDHNPILYRDPSRS